jgi:Cu/Ag efflux pump CusA
LGDVAKVRSPSASVIRHDGVKRYVDVIADVKGRELAAVAGDIDKKLKGLKYPHEYYARVLGDYAAPQAAQNHLILITSVAAVGVFFLLQSAFGSWRLAAISFLTIPAALIGGLLAAIATGGTVISLGALAGLLAVFGVAVCSSLTLIKHYQRLTAIPAASNGDARVDAEVAQFRAQFEPRNRMDGVEHTNGAGFGPGLVQHGAVERLGRFDDRRGHRGRTRSGSVSRRSPGLEIIRPMVIVTLGGLVTSTLFTLRRSCPVLTLRTGRGSILDDLTLTMTDDELREATVRAHVEQATVSAIEKGII